VAGSAGRVDWLPHQRLAGELGIRQRVEWLGFVDASKLTDLHRQSLCLVSTSRLESSGLTLIEAMAAGCPVVASRIPAFVEYADQAALLVEPGNPSQFAAAVLKLHRNQALREQLIALGRRRAQDYRWSIWAPRFAQVIAGAA
jgi:glycosyltransferase involved in cell wall biosynthesis